MSNTDTIDLAALRGRLEAMRDEILDLSEHHKHDADTVEVDQTRVGRLSRMDALQSQAMAQATDRRRLAELKRIQGALERMDEGSYGECVGCGESIGAKRLENDPSVPTCIECARRGEH